MVRFLRVNFVCRAQSNKREKTPRVARMTRERPRQLRPLTRRVERQRRRVGPRSRSRKRLTMLSSSTLRHTRESPRKCPSSKISLFPLSATSSRLMELLLEKCSETFTPRISLSKWVIVTALSLSTLELRPRPLLSKHPPRSERLLFGRRAAASKLCFYKPSIKL